MNPDSTEIIFYQTDDGRTKIDVRMEDETVWLTQANLIFTSFTQNKTTLVAERPCNVQPFILFPSKMR